MNPELRRNLWLEFGWHRRIAAPAVILLVLGLFAAGADSAREWRSAVYPVAFSLAVIILFLWGSRQASEAVSEEVRERTWDLQRLSAQDPWALTWGKLFGATVFPWYAGAICLAAVAVSAPESVSIGWHLLATVAGAVALHAAALGASLQAARKSSKAGQRFGAVFLIGLVIAGFWVMPHVGGRSLQRSLEWYGLGLERVVFLALSAVVFAAWAVFGAYRSMCRELQVHTLPWAWPAFAVFVAFWFAGFVGGEWIGTARAFVFFGLLSSVTLTYLALFGEVTTAMLLRRAMARARSGQWRRFLEEIPVWPATLLLGGLFALAAPFAFGGDATAIAGMRVTQFQKWATTAPIAFVLLALRDCAILVFFACAARPRRVEAVTIVYMVLLWWVVPGFLAAVGLGSLAQIVLPFASLDAPKAAVIMALQAALACALAAWRYRRNYGRAKAS